MQVIQVQCGIHCFAYTDVHFYWVNSKFCTGCGT